MGAQITGLEGWEKWIRADIVTIRGIVSCVAEKANFFTNLEKGAFVRRVADRESASIARMPFI